jgi:hypothetical protein
MKVVLRTLSTKIVCINNDDRIDLLTIGKIYETKELLFTTSPTMLRNISDYYFLLSRDDRKPGQFIKKRFITLREHNLSKLT